MDLFYMSFKNAFSLAKCLPREISFSLFFVFEQKEHNKRCHKQFASSFFALAAQKKFAVQTRSWPAFLRPHSLLMSIFMDISLNMHVLYVASNKCFVRAVCSVQKKQA